MNAKTLIFVTVLIFFGFTSAFASDCAENKQSGWIICEDWDHSAAPEAGTCTGEYFPYDYPTSGSPSCGYTGSPDRDSVYPSDTGQWFTDTALDTTGESGGNFSSLDTSITYNSSVRSFKIAIPQNYKGSANTYHEFGTTTNIMSIRFYYRQGNTITADGWQDHFIFFNTASVGNLGIDIAVWTHPTAGRGLYFCLNSPAGYAGGDASLCVPYDLNDHVGEWIRFEWKYNRSTNKADVWIWDAVNGEVQYFNQKSFVDDLGGQMNTLIISGFVVQQALSGFTGWIDNIVVDSTGAYIGPASGQPASAPSAPTNLKIITTK